jgi:hypothetical protein
MSLNVGLSRLVKILLYSLFIIFFVVAVYLLLNLKTKTSLDGSTVFEKQNGETAQKNENIKWEPYLNMTYRYALMYPGTLTKNEYEDEGGYLHFIRFEENELSVGKGVAVGVTKRDMDEEVSEIKKQVLDSEIGKLSTENKIVLKGLKGIRLDFEPKAGKVGEKRAVVVVNKNSLSYSISTVPEQIDIVLESFTFFD